MEKEKDWLILPLQYFASDEDEPEDVDRGEVEEEESKPEKTYSQAELDSETSKRVEKALKKREKENEKAIQDAVKKAIDDFKAREKMTDDERAAKALKDREDALKKREEEADLRDFKAKVVTELATQKLPTSFADLIVKATDADGADELIGSIKKDIDAMIAEAIKGSARQSEPRAGSTGIGSESELGDLAEMARKHRKFK